MKKFQVTVNGNRYEVDVEELSGGQTVATPVAAPVAAVAAAPVSAPKAASASGSVKIEAPMQGKIVGVKVTEGASVAKGDVIAILEAMKMENEVVASEAGTVASINVAVGQSVEAGDLIASLN
jgi:biotin carboxyl carrier protein